MSTSVVNSDYPVAYSQFADNYILPREASLGTNSSPGQRSYKFIKTIRTRHPSHAQLQTLEDHVPALLDFWLTLTHPNIESFLGTMSNPGLAGPVQIATPFHENGNIRKYVQENPDVNKLALVNEALQGLIYLHNRPIVHGNIYSGNILINAEGHAVITDTGLNTIIRMSADFPEVPHQYRWVSHEVLILHLPPTTASDIYSFGRTIEEILTLSVPFADVRGLATFLNQMAASNGKLESATRPGSISPSLWAILQGCFTLPELRLTAEELLSLLMSIEV